MTACFRGAPFPPARGIRPESWQRRSLCHPISGTVPPAITHRDGGRHGSTRSNQRRTTRSRSVHQPSTWLCRDPRPRAEWRAGAIHRVEWVKTSHPQASPLVPGASEITAVPPQEQGAPESYRAPSGWRSLTRPRKRVAIGMGAALAALALLLILVVHPGGLLAPSHALRGTVDLLSTPQLTPGFAGGAPTIGQGNFTSDGTSCSGTNGYDDMNAGGQVVIKDASGSVIATTSLSAGKANPQAPDIDCVFSFQVTVPDTAFYQVSAGHRNAVSFSRGHDGHISTGRHLSTPARGSRARTLAVPSHCPAMHPSAKPTILAGRGSLQVPSPPRPGAATHSQLSGHRRDCRQGGEGVSREPTGTLARTAR